MIEVIKQWYSRHFSDPQAVILTLSLLGLFALIVILGEIMTPVIAAMVLAYVLEGLVGRLERIGLPRVLAVILVFVLFALFCVFVFFGVMPLLLNQLTQLGRELPNMLAQGQAYLLLLPQQYPAVFSEQQVQNFIDSVSKDLLAFGQAVVSLSLAKAVGLLTFLVYVVLVPILVFFCLKDKTRILVWLQRFLPQRQDLSLQVWRQVDSKIGSYIRGKIIEILIIWLVSYITFALLGLQYALLLSFLVGISVIVPYVGAIATTLPVGMIAYFQWGIGPEFWWVMGAYGVIQLLDGNLLVPIIFSEAVKLHPVAIIVAIVFFGGFWGVWGVFFAIPLATLVDSVLEAWPRLDTYGVDSADHSASEA